MAGHDYSFKTLCAGASSWRTQITHAVHLLGEQSSNSQLLNEVHYPADPESAGLKLAHLITGTWELSSQLDTVKQQHLTHRPGRDGRGSQGHTTDTTSRFREIRSLCGARVPKVTVLRDGRLGASRWWTPNVVDDAWRTWTRDCPECIFSEKAYSEVGPAYQLHPPGGVGWFTRMGTNTLRLCSCLRELCRFRTNLPQDIMETSNLGPSVKIVFKKTTLSLSLQTLSVLFHIPSW